MPQPVAASSMAKFSTWSYRLLALLLLLLMQGPAMLVQEVAWAQMLVSYTQERGLKRGVVETFDGNHPCELCAKASELREDERRDDPLERPSNRNRFQFSWAEMVPLAFLRIPKAKVIGDVCGGNPRVAGFIDRGRDLPPLPPPKGECVA